MATSRSLRDVFSRDKYPPLSFAFVTDKFDSNLVWHHHIIEVRGDKLLACCYERENADSGTYLIVLSRDFFTIPSGANCRFFLKMAIANKLNKASLQYKGLLGIIWTNDLPKYVDLYDQRITEPRIWDTKSIAKLDYNRTAKLIHWVTSMSTFLQRNVNWNEVSHSFSAYVNDVYYPSDTLVSNFRSVAKKYMQKVELIPTM